MIGLPPLSAIRVFEAVVRHLNFTRAAEELGMTQAAVSYQIKLLEERVGAPLFLRKPRQVELSEVGPVLRRTWRKPLSCCEAVFLKPMRKSAVGFQSFPCLPLPASGWRRTSVFSRLITRRFQSALRPARMRTLSILLGRISTLP